MRGERPGHTLQTTALVNEVYLRLVDVTRMSWQNRIFDFFAVCAQLMCLFPGGFRPRASQRQARW